MKNRVMLHWLAGTLGGILGWMIVEPWPWLTTDPQPGQPPVPFSWAQTAVFGLVIGAAISGCIGAAYGAGSAAKWRRSALIGALLGMGGGAAGLVVGQFLYGVLSGRFAAMEGNAALGPLGFIGQILARSLGWGCIGLGLGILQGGINGSPQRSRNGAIGGIIGGLLGGFVFELLNSLASSTTNAAGQSPFFFFRGEVLRFIGLALTGSAIGLFVGLAERAFRNAWVRVRAGRNEGTEFLLEKPSNTLGRDELSDVPLFGDASVQKQHATISRHGTGFVLSALAPGVMLNGQPMQAAPLQDGDVIGIGTREVEFHQKGAPRAIPLRDAVRPAMAPIAVADGVCAFCGERFDPHGRCSCSPAATPPPVPSPAAATVAAATGSRLRLRRLKGPDAGQDIPLAKPETTFGREPDRDVRLEDASVSRRHARILVGSSGGVEVVDDGSSNGTFVNGARVQRSPLRPGDEVAVGNALFRLETA